MSSVSNRTIDGPKFRIDVELETEIGQSIAKNFEQFRLALPQFALAPLRLQVLPSAGSAAGVTTPFFQYFRSGEK
jgi:hypothetical protein